MNRAIVEKLPPLRRECISYRSPFRLKEAMTDCQQDTFPWSNPHQRRHKSATARQNKYSEENPECHRLAHNRNDCQAHSDHFIPKDKKTLNWLEVHWGNEKPTSNRRWVKHDRSKVQQFDTDSNGLFRQRDETIRKSINGTLNKSQHILCENESWMTAEIQKKEILLQEKLLKAAETLKNVQLRNASKDKKKEEHMGTGKAENGLYYKKGNWKRCGGDSPTRHGNHVKGTHAGQKEKNREEKEWENRGRQTQRTTETAEKEYRRFEDKARPMREKTRTEENNTRRGSAMEHEGTMMRIWEQKDCQKETGISNDGENRRNEGTELKGDIEHTVDQQEKEIGRPNDGGKTKHEGRNLKGKIADQHSNSTEDYIPEHRPDNVTYMPCKTCKRLFTEDRLETHVRICVKTKNRKIEIFDSKRYRAQGTDLEKFNRTNIKRKEPPPKKSNWQAQHKALQQCSRPTGEGCKPIVDMTSDYKTCPHCSRRYAPGIAETHIPACPNIKNKPRPLPHRP